MPHGQDALISVVMPVHNALPFLDDAVRSILEQTHRNFEFVIYDDASTDGSTERLRELAATDPRIRLFEGKRNLGPVGSSAYVVECSSAPLIARMDADDLCSPERLKRQLELLQLNPEVGLVGTLFDVIDSHGRCIRGPDFWRLQRKAPFVPFAAHGSILFRRSVFEQAGGYRAECEYWEDQDLVVRMAAVAEVMVIPEPLYRVRQWTRPGQDIQNERVENAIDLAYRSIAKLERGESYDDLLAADPHLDRVDPRVFISTGSRVLWAGARPQLFRRLLRRGKLGFDIATLTSLVWTAWASLSPATLRPFLKFLLRLKNARAAAIAAHPEPLRWSPYKAGAAPAPHRVRSSDALEAPPIRYRTSA